MKLHLQPYYPLLLTCMFNLFLVPGALGQDADKLLERVRAKLGKVKKYTADAILHTDVSFLNMPDAKVKVYYSQPDQFRVVKENGISILPKGGLNVGVNSLLPGREFVAVPAGYSSLGGRKLAVVKLLPTNDNSDFVLSTIYIDESSALVHRAVTTTRDNGTYETELYYGSYTQWGLPDSVIFTFNISEYKLPKAVTMEYEGARKKSSKPVGDGKGRVRIRYTRYNINQDAAD